MRLWKMLLSDVDKAEREVNMNSYWPPVNLKKVKYIKIHPHVFHDLADEEATLLKENKIIRPYVEYDLINGHKFRGIPLRIDRQVEKWEVVI